MSKIYREKWKILMVFLIMVTLSVKSYSQEISLWGGDSADQEITNGSEETSEDNYTDFGMISVTSGTIERTFTIKNEGSADLSLTGSPIISITTDSISEFTVLEQPSSSIISADGTLTFTVKFNPAEGGVRYATVSIANDDSDENPFTFAIQGIGYGPEINVSGNSVDIIDGATSTSTSDNTSFGSVNVGSSVTHTFSIQNVGVKSLSISAVTVSGTGFARATSPASSVSAGKTTSFTVTFTPTTSGSFSGEISITNGDANETPYNFTISGTGIAPEITIKGNSTEISDGDVTPTTTDDTNFGSVAASSGYVTKTYTVKNDGAGTLTISDVALTQTGSDFSIVASPYSPLSAGAWSSFQVKFVPTASGTQTATVTVTNNDTDEGTYNFDISGTGFSAPSVATVGASSVTSTGATMNGTVSANGGSTAVTFEYGTTTSYGSVATAIESPVTGTGEAVSYTLTGLVPNTMYYYRVVGQNTAGSVSGEQMNFTTLKVAPTVTTGSASSITSTGATLSGTVNANNSSTAVTFYYRTEAEGSYTSYVAALQSPVTGTSATLVTASLSGLTPNTTYYYYVYATSDGGSVSGTEGSFSTTAIAPTATTSAATNVTSTTATLNGTVNANNSSTTVTFEYGTSTSYGTSVTSSESPVSGTSSASVTYSLSGLTPNTTYHVRVVASNASGSTYGSDVSFTTSAALATVTTGLSSSISETGATLAGAVNASNSTTIVSFEYGLTSSYGSTATASPSVVSGTIATSVAATLSGLVSNTTYHYRLSGINSAGTSYGDDATFTTSAASTTTFTGTGNWSSSARWSNGLPGTTSEAIIYGTCTVDGDYTVASLTISGGKVTVSAAQTLNVTGTLTNSVGTSGLVLASAASGTGRLVNSTSGVLATVKQYIEEDQWHYVGVPFAGSSDVASIFKGLYVTKSDESTAIDGSETGWSYLVSGDYIYPGIGYGIYHNIDTTASLTGTLNTGNIAVSTTHNGSGWNLISNPYPCTIDWEVVNDGLSGVNNAIYVYNPATSSYDSYVDGSGSQSQYIAPWQGFFVVSTVAGSVTFTDGAKATDASTFKSSTAQSVITLAVSDQDGRSDQSLVRIKSSATDQFDGEFDAYKLIAASSLTPQLYSEYNDDEYSINSIPEVSKSLVIPFRVLAKQSGTYTVSLAGLENYTSTLPIYVYSSATNEKIDIQNNNFTFSAEAGETVSFSLVFSEETLSSSNVSMGNIFTIGKNGAIQVKGMTGNGNKVVLCNLNGQVVASKIVDNSAEFSGLRNGIYIVKVTSAQGGTYAGKVVVNQ